MAESSTDSGLRRFAGPLGLILTALIVFVAIFSLLGVDRHEGAGAATELEDAAGGTFDLTSLDRRTWIAAFADSCGAAAERTAISNLRDTLPAGMPLVCFSVNAAESERHDEARSDDEAAGRDEAASHDEARDPRSASDGGGVWIRLQDDAEVLTGLAIDRFGFTMTDLDAATHDSATLIATVSRKGRTLGRYRVGPDDATSAMDGVGSDLDFVRSLEGRPALHAMLNATCGLLLIGGLICIRRKRIGAHLGFMVSACLTTLLFLGSYLYYHHHAGSTGFQGEGWSRAIYLAILLTHTVLAAFLVPLVSTLLFHAVRRRFDRHRRLARWTFPIWLYVSITGVLIYFMLYVWFAPA